MGIFGAIGGLAKKVSNGVRGLGRLARGNVKEGLKDIGGAAAVAAPFLIPGVGGLATKGLGALGGLLKGGAAALPGLLGKGVESLGGLEGVLGLGGAALGLKGASDERKANAAFEQKRADILSAQLGKAEEAYDSKAPLRDAGQSAVLGALSAGPGPFAEYLAERKKGTRKAGEFRE